MICFINIKENIAIISPNIIEVIVIRVKLSLASLSLASPINFATIALPPVAIMTLIPINMQITGYTIFIAERAFDPIYLETNIPSIIV